MPQMAPLNWSILMTFSLLVLMMFIMVNYFSSSLNPKLTNNNTFKKISISWKW
uniref:ATP synthase complex subunit 8 n=1 Tax=Leiochrinini sp. 2 ACP-2013 TaxID=1434620 RepID=A0A3G3FWW4_9CUCU|nr:ATP synthase F0 subunit 8 [Leiochrinini sp. 2 ACP-2013]